MGALEPPHLIVILVLVLIIFGPGKLPQLGKAVGDGLRELKHATNDDAATQDNTLERTVAPTPTAKAPTTQLTRCLRCKSAVPITDRFCGACGADQATPPTRPSAAPTAVL